MQIAAAPTTHATPSATLATTYARELAALGATTVDTTNPHLVRITCDDPEQAQVASTLLEPVIHGVQLLVDGVRPGSSPLPLWKYEFAIEDMPRVEGVDRWYITGALEVKTRSDTSIRELDALLRDSIEVEHDGGRWTSPITFTNTRRASEW